MKLVLLLPLLYVATLADKKYGEINKTSSIDILSYGTQAAKDIRAIGRSYAYQLIKKQQFTDYVGNAVDILNDDSLPEADKAKKYAEEYTVHIAVVGAGIILAILLGIGFCFTPICCCCCNKSQKQDSGMAMWRMIWGTILVILLAANIAGLAILVVSGQQVLTLDGDTTATVDSLGNGFSTYLGETDNQIETLRTNQMTVFFNELDPLVEVAIDATIKVVTSDSTLDTEVDNTVAALNSLDSLVTEAVKNINQLSTDVTALTNTVNSIDANLATCKTAAEECDKKNSNANACTAAGLEPAKFDSKFDTSMMDATKINDAKTDIEKLQKFPEGDSGKTLAELANEVQTQWNDLEKTAQDNQQIKDAKSSYSKALVDAKAEINTQLETNVQSNLKEYKSTVETQQADINKQLNATLKYIKAVMLLQEGDTTDVNQGIVDFTKDGIGKYALFALFVLICVILGLLVLTVLVGLVATLIGCCQASDDVLPTERESGCCGNLLMCTSYCSVILCAIACLVAAILVTVVIATEGTCKQYNDDKLIGELDTLGNNLKIDLDVGKMLADALKLESGTLNMQDMLDSCNDNATFFKAFNITKDTKIMGEFSFTSLSTEIDEKINEFKVDDAFDGLNFNPELLSDEAKKDLEDNKAKMKDSMAGYDFDAIKQQVQNTPTTSMTDLAAISTELGKLDASYGMVPCKTAVDEIKDTHAPAVATQKAAVSTSLDNMKATSDKATTSFEADVDKLLAAVTAIDTRLGVLDIPGNAETNAKAAVKTAGDEVDTFLNWLFNQFEENIASCQPVAAVYYTVFNYTCDGILIHLTLIYCGLSLVGISLLFYMCVSRCLARYFIKYGRLHPDDDGGNGWGPYPGHYAQTKL